MWIYPAEFDAARCTHYVADADGQGCTLSAEILKMARGSKFDCQIVSAEWIHKCIRWDSAGILPGPNTFGASTTGLLRSVPALTPALAPQESSPAELEQR